MHVCTSIFKLRFILLLTILMTIGIMPTTSIRAEVPVVNASSSIVTEPILTEVFDVSASGEIAYVVSATSTTGFANQNLLMLYNPSTLTEASTIYTSNSYILDVDFSADGTYVAFLESTRYNSGITRLVSLNSEPTSTIRVMDVRNNKLISSLQVKHMITEIDFAPDGKSIYFLQGELLKSPRLDQDKGLVGFDVYEWNQGAKLATRHSQLQSPTMNSLQLAADGRSYYLSDTNVSTQQPYGFNEQYKQQISKFPLHSGSGSGAAVSFARRDELTEAVWNSDETKLYFTSWESNDSNARLTKALYVYDEAAGKEKQLTHLDEHVTRPVSVGDQIYFMVGDYSAIIWGHNELYAMPVAGGEPERIDLPYANSNKNDENNLSMQDS